MKRLILPAVLLGLVALAIGPRLLWSHIRGMRDNAAQAVEDSLPDDQIVVQAENELKEFNNSVRDYHLKVTGIGDQLAVARAQAEKISKQLDGEKKILARIKQTLDSSDTRFEINGRTYSREDLERDGQARLTRCLSLEEQLRSQQKLIAELTKAHEDGRKWLAEAEQVRTQRAAELQALKVRLTNARARGELNNNNLSPLVNTDTDSGRQLAKLNERVKKLERGNDFNASTTRGVVDWNPPTAGTRDAITKYLKSGTPSTDISAANP
jgi:hypothetical protein